MPPTSLYQQDFGVRPHTAFDLERKLVEFIQQLFTNTYQLDNPAVNRLQPAGFQELHDQPQPPLPTHPIVLPSVPFDPVGRAQTLLGKVPPQVVRGRVPRTVTGDLDPSQLPDFPSITVQAITGRVEKLETHVGVRIYFHAYDENPQSQGYQDLTNMIEVVSLALTSYGQKGINDAYPIVLPLEWKIPDEHYFPHYIGEMHTTWQLPSARPLPDYDDLFPMIPAEHIDLQASESPELEVNLWNGS